MSSTLPAVATPAGGESQAKVENNGGIAPQPHQPLMNVVPSNSGFIVARDTSSIPGVSMYARQWYPQTFYKHDELMVNKDMFFEALNKFHTVLGTRLTKKGRKGKEKAAEVKTFQESIAGIPPLGGVTIDLHLLYVEVTNRGGLEKVIKDRKWREVTNLFKFPDAITSGSYMLRKYYVGLLYFFEQAYFFGKQGPLVPPPSMVSNILAIYVVAVLICCQVTFLILRTARRKRGVRTVILPQTSVLRSSYEVTPFWMCRSLDAWAYEENGFAAARTYSVPDGDTALMSIRKRKILPLQTIQVLDPALSIGVTAQGAIKCKFEQGYLVTVTVGTEKLQGILYHVPPAQRTPQHANVPNYMETFGAEVKLARGEPKAGGSWRKRPRKDEILKKDLNAPRPNRTGYNFFSADQCSKYRAMHPDTDKELSRMIGHAWNSLTEEEKLPYQERGQEDKKRYTKELQEYRERLLTQREGAPSEVVTTIVPESVVEEEESVVDDLADIATDSASNGASDFFSNAATEGCHDFPTPVEIKVESTSELLPQQSGFGTIEASKSLNEDSWPHTYHATVNNS